MYTIKFQAHNAIGYREAQAKDIEAAYQLVCALNYTAFSYNVYFAGGDVTEVLEGQMKNDAQLPVARVSSPMPLHSRPLPSERTITIKELRKMLGELGMTLKLGEDGELRINYRGGKEATAYYTNNRADALGTARAMAQHRKPMAAR